ncbi:DNA helicase RecQ, partial [Listeria monocytogenes]|nr:DNA helicase RecQ [Listeria monocytogenes]
MIEQARAIFQQNNGDQDIRNGQVDVISKLCAGEETLANMPTGGGQSLCYQLPALLFAGLTIVVSPLI